MSLAKSSLLFSLGTMFSRVSGLLRETVTAWCFGASESLDAFIIANRIPNMLREIAAEGALGASFTKVFSDVWEKDPKRAKEVLVHSLLLFGLGVFCISIIGIFFAHDILSSMTMVESSGDRGRFFRDTVGLTQILFPFIGLMSLGSIAAGALHHGGKFFLSSVSSTMLNVGYLLGALGLAPLLVGFAPPWIEAICSDKAMIGLALGVLLGGFLQCSLQIWGIWGSYLKGSLYALRSIPWDQDIKRIFKLMGPMIIAGSATQINVFINTNFATSLEPGAVSWLNYSFRLLQLPIGVFAVAISTVSLPTLSRAAARRKLRTGSDDELARELEGALGMTLWLTLPCLCLLLFNSTRVIDLLFNHGAFTQRDTLQTSQALFVYSFGLIGYGLVKVLTSFYYAVEKTSYAMRVSLGGIFANFAACWFLVPHYGFMGLAASTSTVMSVNGAMLLFGITKTDVRLDRSRLLRHIFYLSVAFVASGLVQGFLNKISQGTHPLGEKGFKLEALGLLSINGLMMTGIYLLSLSICLRVSPFVLISKLKHLKKRK